MLLKNKLQGAAGIGGIEFEYQTTLNDTSITSSYTFSSVDIGDASSDRLVIVAASCTQIGSHTVSGVTIGGSAATIHVNPSATFFSAIASLVVSSGTTADIVVTTSTTAQRCAIAVWTAKGLDSTTPDGTGTASGSSPSTSLTTSVGGIGVGIIRHNNSSPSDVTWSGLTERADDQGASTRPYSIADFEGFTGTSETVSVSGSFSDSEIVCASWR